MALSDRRRGRVADLPESLLNGIYARLEQHTVGFLRIEGHNSTFLGSGVLVSVGDIHAILTAHHVIEHVEGPLKERQLSLLFANRSQHRVIELWETELLRIARGTQDSVGPDLGAALLLRHSFVGSINAYGKAFHNLAKRREQLRDKPLAMTAGIWAAQGFVEKGIETIADPNENLVEHVRFPCATVWGAPEDEEEIDEFDYLDYRADPSRLPIPTDSWGGMSGGGLWRIPLNRQLLGDKDEWSFCPPLLSGIMFYQRAEGGKIQWIRCHGRRSVYEHAFKGIQKF